MWILVSLCGWMKRNRSSGASPRRDVDQFIVTMHHGVGTSVEGAAPIHALYGFVSSHKRNFSPDVI